MSEVIAVTIPRWGLTMEEGTLNAWLVEEGQTVEQGTELAEVESSKIAGSVEAQAAGILRRRLAAEGETLPVGALIGVIAQENVDDAAIDAFIQSFAPVEAIAAGGDATGPKTVVVDGTTLSYLRKGEGGSGVLMIHGFGGDANGWAFLLDALAKDHDTVAVDLPGHGVSTKAVVDASFDGLARMLAEFVEALDLPRVHIVAHSMGGALALALALARPQLVASLTLIAPVGLGPEINNDYLTAFVAADKRKDVEKLLRTLFADETLVSRALAEEVVRYKRLDGVPDALRKLLAEMVSEGRQTASYREKLAALAMPVTVIWGDQDRIVPAAQSGGLDSRVEVVRIACAGHMPHVEAAGQVIETIRRTIARA